MASGLEGPWHRQGQSLRQWDFLGRTEKQITDASILSVRAELDRISSGLGVGVAAGQRPSWAAPSLRLTSVRRDDRAASIAAKRFEVSASVVVENCLVISVLLRIDERRLSTRCPAAPSALVSW